jgi:hypothetical protein
VAVQVTAARTILSDPQNELVGQIACVGEAGENILFDQTRIVIQDLRFGLSGGKQLQDELNCETGAPNHRLARKDHPLNQRRCAPARP